MATHIIVGGGVAGLAAALTLAERGERPLLIEADAHIGGRLRDNDPTRFAHDGREWQFPAEHGVHGLWQPYVNLLGLLERHGIRPDLQPSLEEGWIMLRGARVRRCAVGSAIRESPLPAPFHYLSLFLRPSFLTMLDIGDIIALPRIFGMLLVAMAYDPLAEQTTLAGQTMADLTRGWPHALRDFFSALLRSGLAAHPEHVPAAGYVAFLRFYTLLRRDAWRFRYLRGTGGEQIAQPMASRLAAIGGTVARGTVTELAQTDGGWRVSFTQSGVAQTAEAGQLIVATDAASAERLLRGSAATAALAADLDFPRSMPTAICRLWFDKQPRSGPASGIISGDVLVDNFFWLDRLQPAFSAWRDATGGCAAELHIYGPPEALAQEDVAILAQASSDAMRAFPELRGALVHAALQRNAASHTVLSIAEPARALGVETPWPGLYCCGDWVAHPNPALYLERAATTGIASANAALAARGRDGVPLLPHPEPEPLAGAMMRGMRRLRRAVVLRATRGP